MSVLSARQQHLSTGRLCRRRICHAKLVHPHCRTQSPTPLPNLYPQRSFPTELLLIIFNFVFDDLASYCADSQEAHKECAVCNSSYSSGQKHVVWEWQDDVSSYALFPYSLAGVCRRWRDIMATVPQFWTRLIIYVDTPLSSHSASLQPTTSPPPLSLRGSKDEIYSHLSWSAKLPIEVYILRRRHSTSLGIDTSEQSRTKMIFEAIKPHLHRCHVLRFSVLQSTSLPSIVFDFEGVRAPVLTDLRLECEIDDQRDWEEGVRVLGVDIPATTTSTASTSTVPTASMTMVRNHTRESPLLQVQRSITGNVGRFWCPALSAISLNGRNFRDLGLATRHLRLFLLQSQRGPSAEALVASIDPITDNGSDCSNTIMTLQHVEKMTVAHYSSVGEWEWEFRVEDLLDVVRRERMPRLEFLKLVDLDMTAAASEGGSGGMGGGGEVVELAPTHVHLEELSPQVIRALSSSSSSSDALITPSPLAPSSFVPYTPSASMSSTLSADVRVRYVNEIESFQIIRATLPSPISTSGGQPWDIPDSCDLVLEEINELGGRKSPVGGWTGNRLVCTGCNGFDDDFLGMLTSSSSSTSSPLALPSLPSLSSIPMTFNAPNLQSIHLIDCINYTVSSLKTLISTRNSSLTAQYGRVRASIMDGPPCILELVVGGMGPKEGRLKEEDGVWFEERLVVFRWNVRGSGGEKEGEKF